MPILTVRLTPDEDRTLNKRSRKAGMKRATFVRKLIREEEEPEIVTGADLLAWMERHWGDKRLAVKPRK